MPLRARRLLIAATVLAALAALALAGWRATADLRARLATRAVLGDAAVAIRLSVEPPPPGPLPVRDAWGQPLVLVESPLGQWIVSPGLDGVEQTPDDQTHVLELSPLGQAIDDAAMLVREGQAPDLEALEATASEVLSQEVRVNIQQDIVFENASREVVLAVELSAPASP